MFTLLLVEVKFKAFVMEASSAKVTSVPASLLISKVLKTLPPEVTVLVVAPSKTTVELSAVKVAEFDQSPVTL